MSFLSELRERRLFQIVASTAAGGWIVLEVVNQFVERGVLPDVIYSVTLVLYAGGILVALITGWYHGEKGEQRMTRSEIVLLGTVCVGTLALSVITVQRAGGGPDSLLEALGESGLDPRRVAVLYFEDDSGGELQYLADGLTEGLIDELSRVRGLDVVSRNGSGRVRGIDVGLDSVARILRAGTLVDGSVREDGGTVRISLRLLDGSGTTFQRTSYQAPATDFLDVRNRTVDEASRILREWLGEEVEVRRRMAGTESVAAWALVQRAERARKEGAELLAHHDAHGAFGAFGRADSLLARAAEVDTAWVEPPVLQADLAYQWSRLLLQQAPDRADALVDDGLAHARRALEVDPGNHRALGLRGGLRYVRWLLQTTHDPAEQQARLEAARSDLEAAVAGDPELAWVWSALSHLYYQVGDVPGVVLAARRALEEDAFLSAAEDVMWRLFIGSYDLGQFRQARRWCENGTERFPRHHRFVECRLWMLTAPDTEPDVERGWRLVERMDSLAPEPLAEYQSAMARVIMGGVLARAGLPDSADAVLRRARVDHDVDPTQELLSFEAAMRLFMGEEDRAMDLLKQYVAANPGHSFHRGEGLHWWWDGLADHPEFQQIAGDAH